MVKLNSRHLIFIIAGVAIVTLKTLPNLLIETSGRNSWLSVIAASILILLYVWFVLYSGKKTGEYAIHRVYQKAFGKIFGAFFIFTYMLAILLTIFESTTVESNIMHTNFIVNTPVWFFLVLSTLGGIYVVKKGGAAVVTTTIIAMTLISMSGILLAVLTQKYKDFKYLFPIFENGLTTDFFLSTIKALGALGCVSIFFPYITHISDKKRLIRHSIFGMLFVVQMQIFSIIGVLTTFSEKRVTTLIYPKLTQTQIISYFGFMEAGEIFVMLQVVAGWFMKYCITFYAFLEMLRALNMKTKINSYIVAAAAYAVSVYIGSNFTIYHKSLNILLYVQFFCFILFPVIAFMICLMKMKKEKTPSDDSKKKIDGLSSGSYGDI
jgi:spore germination protein (amino acid permease)